MLISIQVSWLLLGWHTYKEQVTLLLDRLIDRASDLSMLSSTLTGMTYGERGDRSQLSGCGRNGFW